MNETVAAVSAIHGADGGQNNSKSVTFGMLETLDSRCSEQDLVSGMKKCRKIKEKVLPKVYKDDLKCYCGEIFNFLFFALM